MYALLSHKVETHPHWHKQAYTKKYVDGWKISCRGYDSSLISHNADHNLKLLVGIVLRMKLLKFESFLDNRDRSIIPLNQKDPSNICKLWWWFWENWSEYKYHCVVKNDFLPWPFLLWIKSYLNQLISIENNSE